MIVLPAETVHRLVAVTYTLNVDKIIHLTEGAEGALRRLERMAPNNASDPKNTVVSESGCVLPPNLTPNAQLKITTDTPTPPNQNPDFAPSKPAAQRKNNPEPICVVLRLSTIRGLLADFDRLPDDFFSFPAYRNIDRLSISNLLGQAMKQNGLAKLSRDKTELLCNHLRKIIGNQRLPADNTLMPTIIMVHGVLTKYLKTL